VSGPLRGAEPPVTLPVTEGADAAEPGGRQWARLARVLWRNPVSATGGVILLALVVLGLWGPALAPYEANDVAVARMLRPPSAAHPFGTDELGRDVFSRVLIATRVSLLVAVVSVGLALTVGASLGLIAGYVGGRLDALTMRLMDVVFAFPVMLLAIAIVAVLGPGLSTAMVAIAVVYMPLFARITRAGVLGVREEVFIRATRSIGAGPGRILGRHILPNVAAPIIVQTSLSLAFAILSEAALSFLGLGVQPPEPSWGRMLFDGREFIEDAWWMAVFPGLAILAAVLAFNLVGDGLRDALDPRQRSALEARGQR
jgi:peptide/nickel transport system permease protein